MKIVSIIICIISFHGLSQTDQIDSYDLFLKSGLGIDLDLEGRGEYKNVHVEYLYDTTLISSDVLYYNDTTELKLKYCNLNPKIILIAEAFSDTLILTEDCLFTRVIELLSLGDLDNDGTEEIAILFERLETDYADFFLIYSISNGKWILKNKLPFYKRYKSTKDSPISDILETDKNYNYVFYIDKDNNKASIIE